MLTAPIRRMKNLFLNSSRGWVGMDINQSAIHMAQVERTGTEYAIGAIWTAFQPAPRIDVSEKRAPAADNPQIALESMIEQAKRARSLFSSNSAGIAVGGGVVERRDNLDVAPTGERKNEVAGAE